LRGRSHDGPTKPPAIVAAACFLTPGPRHHAHPRDRFIQWVAPKAQAVRIFDTIALT
jgi:hypothetical protein